MSTAADITVSIITPCYNGARYLRETLASAAGQTRPPLEIIVVDDGSTDDSADIAETFGAPVRVIRQPNQGESVARNRGLIEARGTHVLFLDADDLIAPEALQRMAVTLEGRPGGVALMGCVHFAGVPSSKPLLEIPATFTAFYPAIVQTNFGPPHCWMAPVELVRRAGGFFEPLQWFEDWDLWWRVGLHARELLPIDYMGALYRQHAKSQFATISTTNRSRGHAIITARMADTLLSHPEQLRQCADELFWAIWTALIRARAQRVPWCELRSLTHSLARLCKDGPASVTTTRMARMARIVGVRRALWLQQAVTGAQAESWSHHATRTSTECT